MKYFTKQPVCPNCLETLNEGINLIQLDENIFQCSSCGSNFKNEISFTKSNGLTIDFPLFTEVKLNKIETSYVDWVLKGINGNYLITWPWKEVKFIPILISEYLSKFENNKIIIFTKSTNIGKFKKSESIDLVDLSYEALLNSLYFTENDESSQFSAEAGDFLDVNDVFLNHKQLYCKMHINTFNNESIKKFKAFLKESNITLILENLKELDGAVFLCGVIDEEKKVYENFLNRFFSLYGKNFIKEINGIHNLEIDNKNLFNDILSKEGVFELNFYESYELNPKLSINEKFNEGFFNSLEKKFDLIPFSYKFNYYFIKSEDDFDLFSQNGQIYFINEDILTDGLVIKIKEFKPDLMISTNIDSLFGESRFKSGIDNQIYKLFRLDSSFLMFSTVLKNRYKYEIGRKDWFFKNMDIIPHTWDYTPLLNEIKKDELGHLSVFSSNFETFNKIKKSNLKFDFHVVEELEKVESIFHIFNEVFESNKGVKKSLDELVKTPLYITGKKGFRAGKHILNFEYLLSLIFDENEEKCIEVKQVFENVYNYGFENPKNPILDRLIDLIHDSNVSYENLVIIVHGYDVNRLKNLLKEKLGQDTINDLSFASWSSLNKKVNDNINITYGIATRFPIIDYDIFSCELSKVDILCSPINLEKFEDNLKKRFTEKGFKPVYFLSESEDAPELLKETLKLFGQPEEESIEEYNDMLNEESERTYGNSSSSTKSSSFNVKMLKNSDAILIFNENDEAMFLPLKTIYYYENGLIKYIDDFQQDDLEKLQGNDILLNERKTYLLSNELFLEFVINNGNNIIIRRKTKKFQWNGFYELVTSAYKWLDLFNQIIHEESLKTNKDEAKDYLADKISKLDIIRSDKEGIKKVWLSDPKTLETEFGEIKIYNAELPKSPEDSREIFNWIADNYKEYDDFRLYGKKSYYAADELQRLRRNFFRNKKDEIDKNMHNLLNDFQVYIKGKINPSYNLKVEKAQKVKIKKEVNSYYIMDNYKEYI